MMDTDVRQAVIDSVLEIAPEADFAQVAPQQSLREQLDLDSFDFLNLLIALQQRLGVEVPEADYARVDSLDALVAYLQEAMARH
ncbi:acyl carrier protein [Ideonella sp.]|uniref:acyl carrier protein n=1 Tax=Ideonella sp. TaxID=1929293 RepID=UPI0035B3F6B0